MNLILTDSAYEYLRQSVNKEHGVGFRLSIKKTGCSGYSYHPEIIHNIRETDIVLQLKSDLTIYVDSHWGHLLDGIKIDYAEENKSGLKQKKLVITNPQETARCGCGESFHV